MIPRREVDKAARSLAGHRVTSVMAVSPLKLYRRRLRRTQRGFTVGSRSGLTLPEMMVVVAVVAILVALAVMGSRYYRDQFGFSATVRELTHAITVARLRAMQSQTTSMLLIRPLQSTAFAPWTTNHQYNRGDVVQCGPFTYRCIATAGTSGIADSITEPAVGTNWNTYWQIISDYQYNTLLVDVQHCAQNLTGLQPCTTDPNACVWVDASTYTATNPTVSIQFNWLGVPIDYIDHNIRLQGAEDSGGPPANNRVGCVTVTVSSLGRIKHQQSGEQ